MRKAIYFLVFCILVTQQIQGKIYDCFLFFNELDVLEIRLNELYNSVDKFVLVESEETFRGKPKPLYFNDNKDRFAPFLDKIIHIVIKDRIDTGNPWARERFQRDQIMKGLKQCEPNDIIILSDVDEIIRESVIPIIINKLDNEKLSCILCEQTLYRFFLNSFDFSSSWAGTCATHYQNFLKTSPDIFRLERDKNSKHRIPNAGWHFCSMGGQDSISKKYESFSHSEVDTEYHRSLQFTKDYMSKYCKIVNIDETYPNFVLINLKYYEEHGFIYE